MVFYVVVEIFVLVFVVQQNRYCVLLVGVVFGYVQYGLLVVDFLLFYVVVYLLLVGDVVVVGFVEVWVNEGVGLFWVVFVDVFDEVGVVVFFLY